MHAHLLHASLFYPCVETPTERRHFFRGAALAFWSRFTTGVAMAGGDLRPSRAAVSRISMMTENQKKVNPINANSEVGLPPIPLVCIPCACHVDFLPSSPNPSLLSPPFPSPLSHSLTEILACSPTHIPYHPPCLPPSLLPSLHHLLESRKLSNSRQAKLHMAPRRSRF